MTFAFAAPVVGIRGNSTPDRWAFNIKGLNSATRAVFSQVASAQVKAWLAVHSGSLDDVWAVIEGTPGDTAMARMMLHRRRAVVAQVVAEFQSRVGDRFLSHPESDAVRAPKSVASEFVASKAACSQAANVNAAAPPLLFERALLAETEGRGADARADLDQLLRAFPGFLSAAIASARLALVDQDPGQAIRLLVYVERELAHIREGSALLADALHAIGMHEAASRYDLAALICPDHAGSHGNDCAPVDIDGNAANDPRMPAAFIADVLADGRSICNDRGVYYVGRPAAGGSVAELTAGQVSSAPRRGGLRFILRTATFSAVAGGRRIVRMIMPSRVPKPLDLHYRRLPQALRYRINRYVLVPLRRLSNGRLQRVPEQDWRSDISRARLCAGIIRIMERSAVRRVRSLARLGIVDTDNAKTVAAGSGEISSQQSVGRGLSAGEPPPLPDTGDLPPAAAAVLNNLVQRLRDSGSDGAPVAASSH
jgi:hypothetical protein